MTTAAKQRQRGQALVEFLVVMPVLMTFLWYLLHITAAINKSIVQQKHARSQTFLRLMNHSSGPQSEPDMNTMERSAYFVAVMDNVVAQGQDVRDQVAPVEILGVGSKPKPKPGSNNEPGEPEPGTLRQNVRVRTAFGICTPLKRLKNGNGFTDYCATDNDTAGQ